MKDAAYPNAVARHAYNMAVAAVDKPSDSQEMLTTEIRLAVNSARIWAVKQVGIGILTATDREGRVFKIEVTQVDGPR